MCDLSHLLPSRSLEGERGRRWSEEVDLGVQHFSWTMETMFFLHSGNIWGQFFHCSHSAVETHPPNQTGISRCSLSIRAGISSSSNLNFRQAFCPVLYPVCP